MKDKKVENVVLYNVKKRFQLVYRRVENNQIEYFIHKLQKTRENDKKIFTPQTQSLEPFAYFCEMLKIIKNSKSSDRAIQSLIDPIFFKVQLKIDTAESIYQRIQRNFIRAHVCSTALKNILA